MPTDAEATADAGAPPTLPPTGERMVPEHAAARTFWEHVGRYRFARRFAPGRRVLDVACGEGYGAAALARAGALSVIGVDVDPEVVAHARARHSVDARVGDALAIPLPDRSVDLVVSFETIEHVADPARFLDECARVLAPGGLLVVSTPNRPVYSAGGHHNPHHNREFDREELLSLLAGRFGPARLFSQVPERAGWWSLRSLPAERSAWRSLPGFWRVSARLCPSIRSDLAEEIRADAPALVGRDPRRLEHLFDPFAVRPEAPGSGERPYYWIAVASARTSADAALQETPVAETAIEWTDATWNPVTGCDKVSPGCAHCYAERLSERLQKMGHSKYANAFELTLHDDALNAPLGWRKPRSIFVNSMSDLFHADVPEAFIARVFDVMRQAHWHRFQILTKRGDRLAELGRSIDWPENVWMGVSLESAAYGSRVDQLRSTRARVKFLSCEPLLGPLDAVDLAGIDWVIVGGESGPGARPMDPAWALNLRDRCQTLQIPFFFKQWGGPNKKKTGRLLEGRTHNDRPTV